MLPITTIQMRNIYKKSLIFKNYAKIHLKCNLARNDDVPAVTNPKLEIFNSYMQYAESFG
jgi:hypothetical protein